MKITEKGTAASATRTTSVKLWICILAVCVCVVFFGVSHFHTLSAHHDLDVAILLRSPSAVATSSKMTADFESVSHSSSDSVASSSSSIAYRSHHRPLRHHYRAMMKSESVAHRDDGGRSAMVHPLPPEIMERKEKKMMIGRPEPFSPDEQQQQQDGAKLTAGMFDDNANLNTSSRFFHKILREEKVNGVSWFDPTGRIALKVVDRAGNPLRGARVTVVARAGLERVHHRLRQTERPQQTTNHLLSSWPSHPMLLLLEKLFSFPSLTNKAQSAAPEDGDASVLHDRDVVGEAITGANGIAYVFPNWRRADTLGLLQKQQQQQQQQQQQFALLVRFFDPLLKSSTSASAFVAPGEPLKTIRLDRVAPPSCPKTAGASCRPRTSPDATTTTVARPLLLQSLYLVDTTGSMSDEMRYIGRELETMTRALSQLYPKEELLQQSAAIFYRDRGDSYVTKLVSDFTSDHQTIGAALSAEPASGGGDTPEAVADAFEDALTKLSWVPPAATAAASETTTRIVWWVTDAPHHEFDWRRIDMQLRRFAQKGIRVFPILCSNRGHESIFNKQLEFTMRAAAMITMGKHIFLTDDSGIGNAHTKPDVHACYHVTTLVNAMRRAVAMELTGERIEPSASEIIRTVGATPPVVTNSSSRNNSTSSTCVTRDGDTFVIF